MYRYIVITNPHLEAYLHEKGFIPVLTTPIENTRDCWKYTLEYSASLQIEIDNYYNNYPFGKLER